MNSRWAETLVFESEKRSDFRLFARSRSSRLLKSSTTCFPLQDLFERNFLSFFAPKLADVNRAASMSA